MEKIFSYGTLQQKDVQNELLGRSLQGTPFTITGFAIKDIVIQDQAVIDLSGKRIHPGLVKTGQPTDQVSGTLFMVTPQELQAMDHYEVSDYQRLSVIDGDQTFWVYIATI